MSLFFGFYLFLKGKTKPAGSLKAEGKGMSIDLSNAAPGTFFALFGAAVIAFSMYSKADIKDTVKTEQKVQPPIEAVAPKVSETRALPNDLKIPVVQENRDGSIAPPLLAHTIVASTTKPRAAVGKAETLKKENKPKSPKSKVAETEKAADEELTYEPIPKTEIHNISGGRFSNGFAGGSGSYGNRAKSLMITTSERNVSYFKRPTEPCRDAFNRISFVDHPMGARCYSPRDSMERMDHEALVADRSRYW